jgi:hypothetical protein
MTRRRYSIFGVKHEGDRISIFPGSDVEYSEHRPKFSKNGDGSYSDREVQPEQQELYPFTRFDFGGNGKQTPT